MTVHGNLRESIDIESFFAELPVFVIYDVLLSREPRPYKTDWHVS